MLANVAPHAVQMVGVRGLGGGDLRVVAGGRVWHVCWAPSQRARVQKGLRGVECILAVIGTGGPVK
eukprot:3281339-Pyramimonas_sp.AAC.2